MTSIIHRRKFLLRCAQVVKELAQKCNWKFGCDPYAQAKLLEAEAAIRKLKDPQ